MFIHVQVGKACKEAEAQEKMLEKNVGDALVMN